VGIVIERRTELAGEAKERVVDEANDLLRMIDAEGPTSKSRLLRAIDPYMDTAFNQRQLPELSAELDVLAQADDSEGIVRRVHELVRHALGQIHEYVVLVGD
jgi:hypothetical protein